MALTMAKRFERIDWIATIISTALPKVAFNSPVTVSLWMEPANSSVESPRIFARGTSQSLSPTLDAQHAISTL